MEKRLVVLAATVPAAVLLSVVFPPMAVVAAVLIPAASLGWALPERLGWWVAAVVPGGVAVAAVAPEGLTAYGAAVLAGPVVARLRRAGVAPGRALVWGVAPVAAWAVGLAISGFDPFPEDAARAFETLWQDGGLPPEQVAELQASSETALEALRRTWVASEVVWSWVTLTVAWWLLGRLGLRLGHPGQDEFSRFDVPDAWVGAMIGGLAAVLADGFGDWDVVGTVGWNLVLVSGFAFAVRGTAIQNFWMKRGGWKRPVRGAVLVAGLGLALPVFLAVATGLGLFDAWFDFRRLRGAPADSAG